MIKNKQLNILHFGTPPLDGQNGSLTKTSISRDMGSATKAALILNRSVVQFRSLGRPTDISKSYFNVNV